MEAQQMLGVLGEYCKTDFGHVGDFILKKQLENIGKTETTFKDDDAPTLIDTLAYSLEKVIGTKQVKEVKKELRRKCELPI